MSERNLTFVLGILHRCHVPREVGLLFEEPELLYHNGI